ncbi:hypothetical protein OVN18_06435 [Microcella daejeonensis]|uniref:Uncharacterized protein n=1 Tax=Microcella daejeonensis TaxID=2994971 RepID=A0A9E8MMY2_9MICO|nr:hypothetical protein [Microcella daejeonensis]WAB82633.1 hypothetical protein OVN18_06435 [Microcella daejeonensis]WAB84809.1 hypothetical protein OVN20_04380 [Microcella daejeonensis]
MSAAELARVRARIAQLPARARGAAAVDAGRGIAAEVVLGEPADPDFVHDGQDLSTVPVRWIVFGCIQLLFVIMAGASHFGGRGGRLEPEEGANVALVCVIVGVALSALALRLLPIMPPPVRTATRTTLLIGSVILPLGFVLGIARLLFGEASEVDVMVRAAIVQALGAFVLLMMFRRVPGPVAVYRRYALSDAQCARLRADDPPVAQRMKDAEIQALLALTALGQVDPQLAERESARIDERWGAGLVDGAS